MAQLTKITIAGFTAGSQASGTAWMTNYTVAQTGLFYVTFELATAVVVAYTVDGSNYYNLNGGVPFNAGWNTVPIPLENGDTFNLNQSSGAGVTVNALRIEF